MSHSSKRLLFPAVALLAAASSSCIYDDLPPCDDGKIEITIVNDWRFAPEADPEGMAYIFCREGIVSPWRFDFPGRDAGKVALPAGDYRLILYNDDTSDILFKTLEGGIPFVTTSSEKMTIDDRIIYPLEAPDMMWGTAVSNLRISADGVEYTSPDSVSVTDERFVIRTFPRQLTPCYTVKVIHVDNLQGVAAMMGIISGMSSGIDLSDDTPLETEAEISFTPHTEPDSALDAEFHTFGRPSGHEVTNTLRLYFRLSDGRILCRSFDVTDAVTGAPDPMNVKIVIDSISLPYTPPPSSPGAFDPNVAGWTTVIVNIET